MAKQYRVYEPDQLFLMPPSLREWLPEDHLAYFVSDLVDDLELLGFFAQLLVKDLSLRGVEGLVVCERRSGIALLLVGLRKRQIGPVDQLFGLKLLRQRERLL